MATEDSAPKQQILWITTLIVLALLGTFTLVCVGAAFAVRNRRIFEVSQLCFTVTIATWLVLTVGRMVYLLRQTRDTPAPPRAKVYSFPRRFGLGTLLVVTLAFGALSAFFRWLEWPGEVVLGALFFVGLVSAAQFAFDRVPRHASMLTGSLLFDLWPPAAKFLGEFGFARIHPFDVAFMSAGCALAGAITGYCTGTLVGSIFMFM